MSKLGIIRFQFLVFRGNKEIHTVFLYSVRMRKNMDQKKTEFGNFPHNVTNILSTCNYELSKLSTCFYYVFYNRKLNVRPHEIIKNKNK